MGYATPGVRGSDGDIDQRRQLRGVGDHLVVLGDILEQMLQVDFLLIARAKHAGLLHAGDGEHRGVVKLGVVKPIQQVDCARPGSRQAHADPAGLLRVRRRHEGGRFFMVDQDELDLVGLAA